MFPGQGTISGYAADKVSVKSETKFSKNKFKKSTMKAGVTMAAHVSIGSLLKRDTTAGRSGWSA